MKRLAIALTVAATAFLVLRFGASHRGDAPGPAPVRTGVAGSVPTGGTGLAEAPTDLSGPRRSPDDPSSPSDSGPWLVVAIDPAVTPVSHPSGVLVDAEGSAAGELVLEAPTPLAGLEPGTYTLLARNPGWRFEPDLLSIGAEAPVDSAALVAPENLYAGEVVDRTTRALVVGAEAQASYQERGDPGVMLVGLEDPAPSGAFRLGGVPVSRGRVRFTFAAPGYIPASTAWLDAGPGIVHADLVVELVPDDALPATLLVRVVDGDNGRPVPALVTAHRLDGFLVTGLYGTGRDVEPRIEGSFDGQLAGTRRQVDVASGAAELALRAPARYQLVVAGEDRAPFLSDPFDVLPEERVERHVLLQRGARLDGRVVVAAGDPSIEPPRSVLVTGPRSFELALGADGAFTATGLPDGDYLARVQGAGGAFVQGEPFSIWDGEDVSLVVRCGAARAGSTLEGMLVLPAEAAHFAVQVGVTGAATLSGAASLTTADTEGRFEVHGLTRGEAFVAATGKPRGQERDTAPPRRVLTWATATVDGQRRTRIRLDATATRVEFRLLVAALPPDVGEVECYVSSATGDPRARALLPEVSRMFLAPGQVDTIFGLPPGDYVLEGPRVRSTPFTAGATTTVSVSPE